MIVMHNIEMDLAEIGITKRIFAVQGDKNTRSVKITLTCAGEPWKIPDGVIGIVRFRKPDDTGGTYDTMPDGSVAVTVDNNAMTAQLAPQMLTAPGCVLAQVEMTTGEKVLCTFAFKIVVEPDPSVGTMDSDDYINLSEYISRKVADSTPSELPNPNAITFTGGVTGTYDGSAAKTVNIPTSLKNPYSLTIDGVSYNGSKAVNFTDNINSMIEAKGRILLWDDRTYLSAGTCPVGETVSIPANDYTGLEVIFVGSQSQQMLCSSGFVPVGITAVFCAIGRYNAHLASRAFSYDLKTSEIRFQSGYIHTGTSTNDTVMLPIRIYGYK